VYIASPYTKGDQALNVAFQLRTWDQLLTLGVVPIAPLWTHFQHLAHPRRYQDWIDYDNAILARCDACLRVPAAVDMREAGCYYQSQSTGADDEVALSLRLGKPVFYSLTELKEWIASR
jgi:hypothetical protein